MYLAMTHHISYTRAVSCSSESQCVPSILVAGRSHDRRCRSDIAAGPDGSIGGAGGSPSG